MQQDNTPRRLGLGRNWIGEEDKKPAEKTSVRVRSGTHLVTGRLIGKGNEPRAFVWVDEAANDPKRDLVICPDLNGSWLWEDGKETSLDVAFPGNKGVQRLARKFDYWLKYLEAHWSAEKSQRFFWGRFDEEGLGVARRLQALVIDEAVVRYWRPAQDPRHQQDREIRL